MRSLVRACAVALALLVVPQAASAATTVAYSRMAQGQDLTVSNPQATTVTGAIRLVPRSGQSAVSIPFSLAPGATQNFTDVLTSFSTTAASIVAIESTNAVNTNAGAIPVAFANRSTETSFWYFAGRNNPAILIGLLIGDVRVTIFDRTTGSTLASQVYTAGTTASTLAVSVDSLVGSVSVSNGGVRIEPITGNAVVSTDYIPGRVRSVRRLGAPVPDLAITGTGYAFSSGFTAAIVSPTAGATYAWTVFNGAIESATTGTQITFAIHNVGYTTVRVDVRYADGSVTSREANVRVSPIPCTAPSAQITSVTSAVALTTHTATAPSGAASYTWGISNGTILSGQSTRSISYRVGSSGTTSLSLTASNGSGCTATDTASVSVVYPNPTITVSLNPSTIAANGSSTVTVVCNNCNGGTVTAGAEPVTPNGGAFSGSGTFTFTIRDSQGAGDYLVKATGFSLNPGGPSATAQTTLHVTF